MSDKSPQQVLAEIESLARDRLGWQGALEPHMQLVEDLGLDSLKTLELAVAIENHFQIRIDEAAEEEIISIGDLVTVVCTALSRDSVEAD